MRQCADMETLRRIDEQFDALQSLHDALFGPPCQMQRMSALRPPNTFQRRASGATPEHGAALLQQ